MGHKIWFNPRSADNGRRFVLPANNPNLATTSLDSVTTAKLEGIIQSDWRVRRWEWEFDISFDVNFGTQSDNALCNLSGGQPITSTTSLTELTLIKSQNDLSFSSASKWGSHYNGDPYYNKPTSGSGSISSHGGGSGGSSSNIPNLHLFNKGGAIWAGTNLPFYVSCGEFWFAVEENGYHGSAPAYISIGSKDEHDSIETGGFHFASISTVDEGWGDGGIYSRNVYGGWTTSKIGKVGVLTYHLMGGEKINIDLYAWASFGNWAEYYTDLLPPAEYSGPSNILDLLHGESPAASINFSGGADIDVRPAQYYEYDDGSGNPIWNTSTGAMLRDPVSGFPV
jgi:hypothetical protein